MDLDLLFWKRTLDFISELPVRHIFSWYLQFRGILKLAFSAPVRHLYDVILTVLSDGESQHISLSTMNCIITEHICTLQFANSHVILAYFH